jgi:hypothetical protein
VTLSDIDDKENSFIAGELGGDFVPWACPNNWRPLATLTGAPRTYGRPENIGGNFLTVGGSVRWVNPDVSAEVLDQLRGPDLAGSAAAGLTITQPRSFPVPPDALREDGIDFGDHLYGSAMRNNQGQLVELSVGRRKGERDAHDSDVNRLSKCHDLFQLQCFGDFTDESLKTIGMLQELRTLRIASDSITDDGLLVLAELRMLTQLTISGRQITAEGIEALQKRMPECKIVRSRY